MADNAEQLALKELLEKMKKLQEELAKVEIGKIKIEPKKCCFE